MKVLLRVSLTLLLVLLCAWSSIAIFGGCAAPQPKNDISTKRVYHEIEATEDGIYIIGETKAFVDGLPVGSTYWITYCSTTKSELTGRPNLSCAEITILNQETEYAVRSTLDRVVNPENPPNPVLIERNLLEELRKRECAPEGARIFASLEVKADGITNVERIKVSGTEDQELIDCINDVVNEIEVDKPPARDTKISIKLVIGQ